MRRMRGLPRTFWYLWTGALINRLGAFVFTYLAIYLTSARHFSVAEAGLIVSLWGIGGIASGPVGGILADRLGRRRTMLLGFSLSAGAMVQLGLARSPWHIALSTMILGFFNDLYRPAQAATVADVVPAADRTRAYGYLYWAVNLGFAGAAVLAGLAAQASFTLLFVIDAATTLAFGIIVFLRVPESHPERHSQARTHVPIRAPFSDRVLMAFIAAQFLMSVVFAQGSSSLPMDMTKHGIAPATYGWLVAINGILICVCQPTAIKWVARRKRSWMLALGARLRRARLRAVRAGAYASTLRADDRGLDRGRADVLAGDADGAGGSGAGASARQLSRCLPNGVGRVGLRGSGAGRAGARQARRPRVVERLLRARLRGRRAASRHRARARAAGSSPCTATAPAKTAGPRAASTSKKRHAAVSRRPRKPPRQRDPTRFTTAQPMQCPSVGGEHAGLEGDWRAHQEDGLPGSGDLLGGAARRDRAGAVGARAAGAGGAGGGRRDRGRDHHQAAAHHQSRRGGRARQPPHRTRRHHSRRLGAGAARHPRAAPLSPARSDLSSRALGARRRRCAVSDGRGAVHRRRRGGALRARSGARR